MGKVSVVVGWPSALGGLSIWDGQGARPRALPVSLWLELLFLWIQVSLGVPWHRPTYFLSSLGGKKQVATLTGLFEQVGGNEA